MSRFRTSSRATLMALLFFVFPLSPRLGAQEQPTFQGEIQVREVGIVVDPPEGQSLASVQPGDILVFEGGEPRPVLKAEPLRATGGGAGPWSVVLYFDRALASPETTLNAALALARKARELTGLGTVEVVVADPEPRVVLAATGEAQALSGALGAIADQARQAGSQAARANRSGGSVAPETATLRRQLDRLVALVAGRPSSGAGALFLVMDAFVPPPGEADLLSTALADDPGPPGTATAALRETARVLAARGLVTFAVPMREPQERKRVEVNDTERIRVQAGPSRHTIGVPPVIPMGGTGRGPLRHEPVVDVLTRPDSAPLMTLAQPTAGTVLGVEEQLGPALQGLAGRWRVWFQAPESPDGSLRRVEVRLPSSKVPLRGPRWIMASTPEGLASSRARLLVGGTTVPGGDVPVDARLEGKELRLRLPALPAAPAGPVRVSVAFDNRSEVKHTVLPDADLGKGWETTLPVQPPTGARKAAVVVEDLARGRWGATAIDLTAAPPAAKSP